MPGTGTMRVKVTTGHCLGGAGNDVYPDQVLEAPGDISLEKARHMVRIGYAVRLPDEAPAQPSGAAVEVRDPVPEHGDPEIQTPERTQKPRGKTKNPAAAKSRKKKGRSTG